MLLVYAQNAPGDQCNVHVLQLSKFTLPRVVLAGQVGRPGGNPSNWNTLTLHTRV